MKVEKVTNHVG